MWRIRLSVEKRQAEREALMIEAMICQAFSGIYSPLRLVKPMCTDAYQVQRNRGLEQESAMRCHSVKLQFVSFLLSDMPFGFRYTA